MPNVRATLGDYLVEDDALRALWLDMVHAVFERDRRLKELERLSDPARILYLVGSFELEFARGGIGAFFCNPTGEFAHETLVALDAVNAQISKSILSRAIALFPEGICPTNRRERYEQICEIEARDSGRLDELMNEYSRRVLGVGPPVDEDLIELQLAYVRMHRASPVLADTEH